MILESTQYSFETFSDTHPPKRKPGQRAPRPRQKTMEHNVPKVLPGIEPGLCHSTNGERRIRTSGSFHLNGLANRHHRPLGHLSRKKCRRAVWLVTHTSSDNVPCSLLLGGESGSDPESCRSTIYSSIS